VNTCKPKIIGDIQILAYFILVSVQVEDAVAGGVIGIIVSVVFVVILITSILGYIQYRRYKNRHIETAHFNFVILPPINTNSRWELFKRACRRKWYKITGRRFKEGLVCKLSGSNYTYNSSYSTGVSYGALLQSEANGSCKDIQVSQLHDYTSGYFQDDSYDDHR